MLLTLAIIDQVLNFKTIQNTDHTACLYLLIQVRLKGLSWGFFRVCATYWQHFKLMFIESFFLLGFIYLLISCCSFKISTFDRHKIEK